MRLSFVTLAVAGALIIAMVGLADELGVSGGLGVTAPCGDDCDEDVRAESQHRDESPCDCPEDCAPCACCPGHARGLADAAGVVAIEPAACVVRIESFAVFRRDGFDAGLVRERLHVPRHHAST